MKQCKECKDVFEYDEVMPYGSDSVCWECHEMTEKGFYLKGSDEE